jgi:hypothetical protein
MVASNQTSITIFARDDNIAGRVGADGKLSSFSVFTEIRIVAAAGYFLFLCLDVFSLAVISKDRTWRSFSYI